MRLLTDLALFATTLVTISTANLMIGKPVMAFDQAASTRLSPPVAATQPHRFTHHGITVEDPYAWLYDTSYPKVDDADVIAYLEAENAYYAQEMAPYQALQHKIFEELKGRLKEDDSSVPAKDGDYFYHWQFEKGAQYRRHLRRPVHGGEAQVILDEVARAEGQDFYRLRALEVSPDATLLAFAEDNDGSERHVIRVKSLADGSMLGDEITNSSGRIVWAADSKSFFYVELSDELRPFRVRHHVLGTIGEDRVVYEEPDEAFFVGLGRSQSREFIFINAGDHITSEIRMIPSAKPNTAPKLIAPRKTGREYRADHAEGRLFILVNDTHRNFRIVTADPAHPEPDNWQEFIAASDQRYLRRLVSFKNFLAVLERIDGLDQLLIHPYKGAPHYVAFPESAYAIGLGANEEYDIAELRLSYESMVTPDTIFDYDLAKRRLITRKVDEIPSGYDKSQYVTERLMATARDGVKIPVSVVYKKGFKRDGSQPVHLYGYGAYGNGMSPSFSTNRLSLLDRGFAYAIAHIRGGDEMGYHWYEDGKFFRRWNTFNDFVDVAKHLVAERYASAGNISISGGSAGGELMGVVTNTAPELWRAVVAHVPFVDVLNTMLNDKLPLTPIEWPEWGNPIEDPAAFAYIRSYSPYDNVAHKDYPPMLITGGLNDPRVTYWEPAKWAAKLRRMKTDDNLLLLKINMGAGHGGKSGRFRRLEEVADEYTFILMQFGRQE